MIDNNKNNIMKSWKLIKGIFNPNLFLVSQLTMILKINLSLSLPHSLIY
jgi:hypothetical protein